MPAQSLRRAPVAAALLTLSLVAALAALLPAQAVPTGSAASADLPTVTPAPQAMTRSGADVVLPGRVEVVTSDTTDPAALRLLREVLLARDVAPRVVDGPTGRAPLTLLLDDAAGPGVRSALRGTEVPDRAEGYAVLVDRSTRPLGRVVLAGADGAGQYYAVQTFRQLVMETDDGGHRIAGARISDFPAMPLRGSIEGFYGAPWTHQERLDQLAFYGDVKANTYIYAPKDDPYHRELWREPYPPAQLAQLAELVDQARRHHVQFTFALSPGNTICYSSEEDYRALTTKFQEMYDIGVRAFNVPLDDIDYARWHCDSDRAAYGAPGAGAAGRAQADLLDRLQKEFIETHEGARPLQMVPTEYYNSDESAYKAQLRQMDEDVVVMWTGNAVVPLSISVADAQRAASVFGGPPFLWDNYPVNDYGQTSGRLLLGPYDKREPGLSDHLAGIVSNPMNQAAASKIAISTIADFAWNDRAYDKGRSWLEALRYLAGDDPAATAALEVFADLSHLAPSFGTETWLPQAPRLATRIEAFWEQWRAGDRQVAVTGLRSYAEQIAAAPAVIRSGAVDPAFVGDARPWLDATVLWGRATVAMLDALQARTDGDTQRAEQLAELSATLQEQARQVRVEPPENGWGAAPVRVGDGVLDTFLAEADLALQLWEAGDVVNVAPQGVATASSTEQGLDRLAPRHVNDGDPGTRWASGYSDDEWVQVELPEPTLVEAVTVKWEAACAEAYRIQVSTDGATWRDAVVPESTTCDFDVHRLDGGDPVSYVRVQGDRRALRDWGYSIFELGIYAAAGS
ncbi:MAG TPA: beta-N-acetylglucosaminidase domain-containing protein [Nocardioides sp.]|nr:beta-N-acetylglucosaminidase domain-containing protein [Nocardioides sp.]